MRTFPIGESRVDWITATAKDGSRRAALQRAGDDALDADTRSGNPPKERRLLGYSGYATRHAFAGNRGDSTIVRVGGELAEATAVHLAGAAERWSRIDYCVSIVDGDLRTDPVSAYWREWHRLYTPETEPCAFSRIQEAWGGYTAYLGKRRSAIFGRVYNKYEESGGAYPPGTWRWEIELKRELAEEELRIWRDGGRDGDDVSGLIAAIYNHRNLNVPWRLSRDVPVPIAARHKSDIERYLAWLARCVRPGVQEIIGLRGPGPIYEALGLDREKDR